MGVVHLIHVRSSFTYRQPSRNSRESHGCYSLCFLNSRIPGLSQNLKEFHKIYKKEKNIISIDLYLYYFAIFSVRAAEVIAAVYTV